MTDTALSTDQTAREHGVLLTDAAALKVKSLLGQEGRDDLRLRVAVQPGGCSGLIYQLYFDERYLDGDKTVDFDGVEVIVDDMSVAVPRRRHDRLQGHDLGAGIHDRQPERGRQLRVRRQLPLIDPISADFRGPGALSRVRRARCFRLSTRLNLGGWPESAGWLP